MYDKIEILENGKGVVYHIADRKSESAYISVEKIEDIPVIHQKVWRTQHSHDFYFLVWFLKGSGTHIIDFKEYPVEANKIFFISPGQLHQCLDMRDFEGVVITFSVDFLNNINREVREIMRQQIFSSSQAVCPVCKILDHDITRIKEDVKRIEDAIKEYVDGMSKKYYLASLLSLFMIDLYNYGQKETSLVESKSTELKIYLSFMDAVEGHFRQLHNAKDYTDKVGASFSTLKRSVIKVSGKTPSLLINERIAMEAKRMLYERTSMRVGEIGMALGFEDNSNFVKFFKRYVGVTPISFREQF